MQTFLPRTIRLAGLLGLSAFGAMFCWGCGRGAPAPQQAPGIGVPLAELRLQPLSGDGPPVSLADLRGSVVLLNFWGTWCPPCLRELPHIATNLQEPPGRRRFPTVGRLLWRPGGK